MKQYILKNFNTVLFIVFLVALVIAGLFNIKGY